MSTLRDDLASLKIDRGGRTVEGGVRRPKREPRNSGPREGGEGRRPRRLFADIVLWLVPLSLLGSGGYYGYTRLASGDPRPSPR